MYIYNMYVLTCMRTFEINYNIKTAYFDNGVVQFIIKYA